MEGKLSHWEGKDGRAMYICAASKNTATQELKCKGGDSSLCFASVALSLLRISPCSSFYSNKVYDESGSFQSL